MVILSSWNFCVWHQRYSSYSAHKKARQTQTIKLVSYTGEKAGVFSNGYTTYTQWLELL